MFSSNTSQVSSAANYIEDVFSTWLYTGNGSTQTITNGIDLSTKGGLVWTKQRSGVEWHFLVDTARGATNCLSSNATNANASYAQTLTAFNTTGYSIGNDSGFNGNGSTYASWTFRKQPKFFDVVTWTGDGNSSQTINHNLGSVPGCIMAKRLNNSGSWSVFHRSINSGRYGYALLNSTAAADPDTAYDWNPTSTTFRASTDLGTNASGGTYVAYIFAHNAGGFGLTGTDNVISCGSFTTDGSGFVPDVNLGYEPQWILLKQTNAANAWFMFDNMRGWSQTNSQYLYANSSGAEASWNGAAAQYYGVITPTGFKGLVSSGINNGTFIYIAIRRGPMKTPTSGTSVFAPIALNGPGGTPNTLLRTTGFPVDLYFDAVRNTNYAKFPVGSRLQGKDAYLATYSASQENFAGDLVDNFWDNNTGISITDNNGSWNGNFSGQTTIMEAFRRAPGFCDVVCYTGNDVSARAVNHNLGVAPELVIVKARNDAANWPVYASALGNDKTLYLNLTNASATSGIWGNTTATSSYFYVGVAGDYGINNATGLNYVAYLFASCPGVSKVGSYTGTGALQTVNCGFTGGARFVLIKRTDSTGDWYVYDSARGISSGNDPYLLMNSNSDEVTGTNYVDTTSVGFQVTAAAPAGLNASGGSYIFLAVA